jgi:ribosomal protein L40E
MAPIPLSKVRTYRSYSGLFWLCIECRKCGRRSEITAGVLAARYGRDALVSAVVKRLVCERCKAKDPFVLIGMKR